MKSMVVSVCGSKKRSFNSNNVWPVLRLGLVSDVEREFQKLISDFDEEELLLEKLDDKKLKGNKSSVVIIMACGKITIHQSAVVVMHLQN